MSPKTETLNRACGAIRSAYESLPPHLADQSEAALQALLGLLLREAEECRAKAERLVAANRDLIAMTRRLIDANEDRADLARRLLEANARRARREADDD